MSALSPINIATPTNAAMLVQPRCVADTGLAENLLGDLLCKHLHDAGVLDMPQLVNRLALTGSVLE
ncbi:MAG: AAA family ATPase, partial [Pseudomonas sp.]